MNKLGLMDDGRSAECLMRIVGERAFTRASGSAREDRAAVVSFISTVDKLMFNRQSGVRPRTGD